jgi:DNA-binding NtrC family response regulator
MSSIIEVKVNFDPPNRSYGDLKGEAIAKFERQFVELTLAQYEGNLSAAAKALSMDRKHLHDMAKKHGLR